MSDGGYLLHNMTFTVIPTLHSRSKKMRSQKEGTNMGVRVRICTMGISDVKFLLDLNFN